MTLRPCASCRRHVRGATCPFCGESVPAAVERLPIAGRVSRAAVFAGATLVGCAPPPPTVQRAAPPPPDRWQQQTAVEAHEPEPPPPDGGGFAKPPVGTATITGTVKAHNGRPVPSVYVTATSGSLVRDAKTDTSGNFEIHDLQAGTYTLVLQPPSDNPRNSGPPPTQAQVTVRDGATEHVNVLLDPYTRPVDRGPCCKPYGAPPARRRVV